MRETYSLYEAKAKLSAIIRRVREGDSVVVTVHGEPVAEIRPIPREPAAGAARPGRLAARGIQV
jgi:prevent-host-death family protein